MDSKALWKKVKVALGKGYTVTKDATVKAGRSVADYAGKAGELTKDKYTEVKLSRKLAKQFTALGARVYELSSKSNNHDILSDGKLKELLSRTRQLDTEWHKAHERTQADVAKIRRGSKGKSQKK